MAAIEQINEVTTITRTYRVQGAEPIVVRYLERRFIPQDVTVVFTDGKWTSMKIAGPNAKKDGTPGSNFHDNLYYPKYRTGGVSEDMPEWAHPLAVFDQTDDDMANAQRVAEGK